MIDIEVTNLRKCYPQEGKEDLHERCDPIPSALVRICCIHMCHVRAPRRGPLEFHRYGAVLRRPDSLPHEPRGHCSGARSRAFGWSAWRWLREAGSVHSSCCLVARRPRRTKRCDRDTPSLYRGGLVSLARRIAGRRRESFIARDYRPCRATGHLPRILEWNRHGAVRHCRGSASRTGVRRVRPDRPRRGVRSSATRALGSNCRPRRWKLDRSQRSLDARLGSSNTLGGPSIAVATEKVTAGATSEAQEFAPCSTPNYHGPQAGMWEITNDKSASIRQPHWHRHLDVKRPNRGGWHPDSREVFFRSEEHTSELQSP